MKGRHWAGLLAAGASALALAQEPVHVTARDSLVLDYPDALAVFAVDPETVEASRADGHVILKAHRAGSTLVSVVLARGVETINVQVDPAPSLLVASRQPGRGTGGSWEQRYEVRTGRYATSLAAAFEDGTQAARLRVEGLHQPLDRGGERGFALPWASLALERQGSALVLLDDLVRESPLTVDDAVVRGLHLRHGALHAFAGVQSDRPFGDLLLPGSGDRVLGFGWDPGGPGLRLVPRLAWLPDSPTPVPGVVSLGLARGSIGDPLRIRGELGWSSRPGASLELDARSVSRQVWLRASHRPSGFAALRLARPAGDDLDAAWTERLGDFTTASITADASRLALADDPTTASTVRAELRRELSPHWSVTAAAGGGSFRSPRDGRVTRRTLAFGGAYDTPDFGVSASLRYQNATLAGDGFGLRLASRAASGGWRGSAYIDAQQQATTVALVLQDRPDLARALAELGFASNDPEELVRLLRDNAALLAERGVTVGPLQVDPLRLQAGLDLSWRAASGAPEFGARLWSDRSPSVAAQRSQSIATLYARWRWSASTEAGVSLSRVTLQRSGSARRHDDALELWVRTSFSGLPVPGIATRAISGVVTREDGDDGRTTPAAGVEVVLDHGRRTATDRDGRFSFERPGAGGHRVEVVLPGGGGVYFTSPSVLTLIPGAQATFGLSYAAALLTGTLRNDAGQPIPGATVRLEGGAGMTATTDSSGTYRIAAPAVQTRVGVDPASLPPGYELRGLVPQAVTLARGAPATADFVVRAQRTLQGAVADAAGEDVVIEVPELGREVRPDAAGNFVLRGLPAGRITLVARSRRGSVRQVVDIPPAPGNTAIRLRLP